MVGFVGPVDRNADVISLLLRELGQLDTEMIEVRREHHVLVGLLAAADHRHRVEHRPLTQQLGIQVHAHRGVLIVLGELSYEETSEATGLKLGTVRSTYHRARAQLADALGTATS